MLKMAFIRWSWMMPAHIWQPFGPHLAVTITCACHLVYHQKSSKEECTQFYKAFMEWKSLQTTYWFLAVGTLRKSASMIMTLIYKCFCNEHESRIWNSTRESSNFVYQKSHIWDTVRLKMASVPIQTKLKLSATCQGLTARRQWGIF